MGVELTDKVQCTRTNMDDIFAKVNNVEETSNENGEIKQTNEDVGWNDEVGVEEVEVVRTKLKTTSLQMANLTKTKEPAARDSDDDEKGDWAKENGLTNEDEKAEDKDTPEETSTEKTEAKPAEDKPASRFVPRHLRGGDSSSPGGSSLGSLVNAGLRGPGFAMRGRFRDPPKVDDQSQFPTLGAAMKDINTKVPEGFERVHNDPRAGGYAGRMGGGAGGPGSSLSTSNKFGKLSSTDS